MSKFKDLNFELIGYCPVDSGQILLGDPCYFLDEEPRPNKYSEDICKATEDDVKQSGQALKNLVVVTRTCWGDGVYGCYATRNKEGRISSVTIDFDNVLGLQEED